jgi:hypothetical protein
LRQTEHYKPPQKRGAKCEPTVRQSIGGEAARACHESMALDAAFCSRQVLLPSRHERELTGGDFAA